MPALADVVEIVNQAVYVAGGAASVAPQVFGAVVDASSQMGGVVDSVLHMTGWMKVLAIRLAVVAELVGGAGR
jgi:hypothetical protein